MGLHENAWNKNYFFCLTLKMEGPLKFWLYVRDVKKVCARYDKKAITRFLLSNISNDSILVTDNDVKIGKNLNCFSMDVIKRISVTRDINYTIMVVSNDTYKIILNDGNIVETIYLKINSQNTQDTQDLQDETRIASVGILYNALGYGMFGISAERSKYLALEEKAKKNGWLTHELFAAPFDKVAKPYSSLFPYVTAEIASCGHASDYLEKLIKNETFTHPGIILMINPPFELTIIEETINQVMRLLDMNTKFSIEIFMVLPI